MRLASYNILDGGLGRLDPLAETLGVIDADIVVLLEANDPAGVTYLAKRGGYESFLAESLRSPYHVALLSRWPIQRAVNLSVAIPSLTRSVVEAVVQGPDGDVRIFGCHFTPHLTREQENIRLKEFADLMVGVDIDQMPTALMGDLNSHAPWHHMDLSKAEPHLRKRFEDDPSQLCTDLIEAVAGRGLTDVHHLLLGDEVPQTLSPGFPSIRLDYIFANGALASRATAAGVEQRGFAPYCSDHYPVWADFGVSASA